MGRALADELLDDHEQTQCKPKFVSLHALKLDLSKIPQQQQQSQVPSKRHQDHSEQHQDHSEQHQDHSASVSQHTVRGTSSPQRSGPVTERVVGSLTPRRRDVIEPQWMQKFKGSPSNEPVSQTTTAERGEARARDVARLRTVRDNHAAAQADKETTTSRSIKTTQESSGMTHRPLKDPKEAAWMKKHRLGLGVASLTARGSREQV